MNKKLQVFVSSTYTDLIEERQAAVQAILDAGHIPAGMELFKAGNESQLKTIYKWIDESDAYMLILGGRYGTIEENSGKSYTQLEYEYALNKDIPVFAVVLSQEFLENKIRLHGLEKTIEQDNPDKYKTFKKFVLSKIIRPAHDCKDIKIAILTTLNEFSNEKNLIGWIRNTSENSTIELLKENNSLKNTVISLNAEINTLKKQLISKTNEQIGQYSFNNLIEIFQAKKLPTFYEKNSISSLDLFIKYYTDFCAGIPNHTLDNEYNEFLYFNICPFYLSFKLLRLQLFDKSDKASQYYIISDLGSTFYAMLVSKNMI